MTRLLAQADPALLVSLLKPGVFLIVLVGWGWLVSQLDKDAAYYYLKRRWFNLLQLGAGVIGFGLMLLVPIFFLGLLVGLMILAGAAMGYAAYRNTKVPEREKWTFSTEMITRRIGEMQQAQAQRRATLRIMTPGEDLIEAPAGSSPAAKAYAAVEEVFNFAIPRNADQIDLVVDGKAGTLTSRIDGVRYPQAKLEPDVGLQVVEFVKGAADLDLADRRKRQIGAILVESEEYGRHRIEIETAGSTRGVSMTFRIDPDKRSRIDVADLGLLETQKTIVEAALNEVQGIVLVSAPPKQGLTTTLYSLLNEHDPYTSSVIAFEDETPFELEGVSHNAVGDAIRSPQLNEKLAGTLRTDPDVVLMTEIGDPSIAQTAADGGEEVRFYIGMTEDDTLRALKAWIKNAGGAKRASRNLRMILAQRLVRKLCTTCRAPYKPDPAALKRLNLPADRVKQLYHASGNVEVKGKPQPCPDCLGLGYQGRTAVFEVMPIDAQAKGFIAAEDYDRLRAHVRKQKMLYLQEAALAKVVDGVTDIKEITRALGEHAFGKRR